MAAGRSKNGVGESETDAKAGIEVGTKKSGPSGGPRNLICQQGPENRIARSLNQSVQNLDPKDHSGLYKRCFQRRSERELKTTQN
jgi:hypothetical protein